MSENTEDILKIDQTQSGILRLILNDPNNKNALSDKLMQLLQNLIFEASSNDSVKVIIIAAVGDVFCSGHNLKDITAARTDSDSGKEYLYDLFNLCSKLMQIITTCSKPVIAEINGVATAAGCQLVASCDLAYASNSAKFATPGVNIGLFCSTPMVALSRSISKKDAMKMLLTGDMIDCREAKRISLINDYVSEQELNEYVINLANKIANKSSSIIKLGKTAFYKQLDLDLSDAYEYTSKIMAKNTLENEAIEGIEAFLEKRNPNWKENND